MAQFYQDISYDLNSLYKYNDYVEPATTNVNQTGAGIVDGQSIKLTAPQNITIDFFSGKPGQKAASSLVAIAKAGNFKIQKDYWSGSDTADYWGPNHRLLDTAYVVIKYKIAEGETNITPLEFITRGKTLQCYNYDKSYSQFKKISGEDSTNFRLGDFVSLQKMDGTVLVGNCQIIDKWTFANSDGSLNTRFRYSIDPPLTYVNGVPLTTQFKMVKGGATWSMITFNFKEVDGVVTNEWIGNVTSAGNNNGYVKFGFSNASSSQVGGSPGEDSSAFSIVDSNGNAIDNFYFGNAVLIGNVDNSGITTKYSWSAASDSANAAVGKSIVRRNVVTLPDGASTVDGYYNGYDVTVQRIDVLGRIVRQTKRVIGYSGAARLATIEDLWNYGYHPKTGDTISLTPAYADSRVSINPPMQLADYVTSKTYGRGLDPFRDLNLPSWLESARLCETQSDVTVKLKSSDNTLTNQKLRYPASGDIIFQGTVVGADGLYVQFTDVLGKLSNKWNSWQNYKLNELVYSDNRLYTVITPGPKATNPTHTGGSINGLQYTTDLYLYKADGSPALIPVTDGNPVRAEKDGSTVPGYSLYDCDGVDYWRLLGWDEFKQRYVTRHQTNMTIDASVPMFDNVNSFLEHFGGIFRYSAGQYYLDVESSEGAISSSDSEVRNITADHIIGKIRLSDEGIRSAFNSLTAAYVDPANKFESRNISFFNSDYLKADRNVTKKGNLTVPGITNYYNTRLLADKYLNKSRFGLTISFNMAPRGLLILAGTVIQLQYPRYSWSNKKFRVVSLVHQEDATVDIVAEEYDDSFYGLSKISKQAASGLAGGTGVIASIDPPTDLRASSVDTGDEATSGVEVSWTNNPNVLGKNVSTELYSSYSSKLYIHITSISGNVLTSSVAHELKAGEIITSLSGVGNLSNGKTYFVKDIPSPTQFTLSDLRDGPILGLANISDVDIVMQTANLTATVPVPTNSYIDVFAGIDGRVTKYYWVRHKITQGT